MVSVQARMMVLVLVLLDLGVTTLSWLLAFYLRFSADWVVRFVLRRDGETVTRVLGMSGGSKGTALFVARRHINPLRTELNGTAWEILDEVCLKMYEWRARKLAKDGSIRIQKQVRAASRG